MNDPADHRVLPGEAVHVHPPAPAEHSHRADDQQRPQAALQADGEDAGWRLRCLGRAGRPQQMFDRAPGHADRERQGDDDQNEPEALHGVEYPKHP